MQKDKGAVCASLFLTQYPLSPTQASLVSQVLSLPRPVLLVYPGPHRDASHVIENNCLQLAEANSGSLRQNKSLEGYGLIRISEEERETWASEQTGTREALDS